MNVSLCSLPSRSRREFSIDNVLVRIYFIIIMIRWTGLAPWEFEFPFPGSLTSTLLSGPGHTHVHLRRHALGLCRQLGQGCATPMSHPHGVGCKGSGLRVYHVPVLSWLYTCVCMPRPSGIGVHRS